MNNNMQHINILTRRAFLDRSFKTGMAVALSTLVDVPFVVKRALAEGNIGLNGKKLLFIFLRGANDALNSVIPILDSAYNATNRPNIMIPADTVDYSVPGACFDPTQYLDVAGTARSPEERLPSPLGRRRGPPPQGRRGEVSHREIPGPEMANSRRPDYHAQA